MTNECVSHFYSARHPALSELLARIAADDTRERVSVNDLLELAGDRAFGALMFIFALPNLVPAPPGTSAVLGLPLVFLSAQLLWGRKTTWLPHFIGRRSMTKAHFAALVCRVSPLLRRFERVLRPRLDVLVSPAAERVLGLALLILAIIVFLPIPFGNILPAAAICILSLALVEHDGLLASVGIIVGGLAFLLIWGALFALVRAGLALVENVGWI